MAFVPVDDSEIEVGKPVSHVTQSKIKENLDDLDARLSSLEIGGGIDYPPIILAVHGHYYAPGPQTGWEKYICNMNIKILGVRLYIDKAGSAGSTEIDIQIKPPAGSYTTLFTTKPSVAFGDGNDAVSTNQVLDPTQVEVAAGSIIRLDTTAVQTGGQGFYVRIDFEKN